MYDKEKGIYPSGGYLVGRDLPLGGYVFTAKNGQKGCVKILNKRKWNYPMNTLKKIIIYR